MLSERERFAAVLYGSPVFPADAIVVLMGQDAKARLAVAAQLMLAGGGKKAVVLTGALDEPPRLIGAARGGGMLLGMGVAPDRVIVEPHATNTHEQALEVAKLVTLNEWSSVLLVASGYHMPRAFLTFLQVFTDARLDAVRIIPMPASQLPWSEAPPGWEDTRLDLLDTEYDKIEKYRPHGHVASYADGLAYLTKWERGEEAVTDD
jgi:uncharacterized SAM-binding protein YcdF (DUF218 family)